MPSDAITAGEAARILDVQPDTLNKYVRRGILAPVQRLTARMWLYSRADIERLRADPPKPGRPRTRVDK